MKIKHNLDLLKAIYASLLEESKSMSAIAKIALAPIMDNIYAARIGLYEVDVAINGEEI